MRVGADLWFLLMHTERGGGGGGEGGGRTGRGRGRDREEGERKRPTIHTAQFSHLFIEDSLTVLYNTLCTHIHIFIG